MRTVKLDDNNTYINKYGRISGISTGKINISLQFFAKDGPGGEKTEEPTAKKLSDARKDGQVSKSKDLSASVILLVSFLVLKFMVGSMGESFVNCFRENYTRMGDFFSGTEQRIQPAVYCAAYEGGGDGYAAYASAFFCGGSCCYVCY